MTGDLINIALGLVFLLAGGEAMVRGASGIGLLARISPAVVGLTIVAAGTSMPELVVSLQAAANGNPGIALGNVVGSNIFNIGIVLGLTALVRPLRIQGNSVKFEWPVMLLATSLLLLLSRDSLLDRVEGTFLVAGLAAFVAYAVWIARKNTSPAERGEFADGVGTASFGRTGARAWTYNIGAVLGGGVLLAFGSDTMVRGSVGMATALGVAPTVIGLTIVAAGTSTPELVTSLVAAYRGRDDIAVTNVLGSNIFNILGIAGTTALVAPVPVPAAIVARDNWWMLGACLLLLPLMRSGMRVTRVEGAVVVTLYAAYTAVLLLGS
ncbi:MAG: cation:H+ antiporter [Planctomycetota bacterium]|jgi:cation:H+ antiporter